MDQLTEWFEWLWERAVPIWVSGGWAMPPIAVIAFAMFGMGMHVLLNLYGVGFLTAPERRWRRWIASPAEARGPIGELIRSAMSAGTFAGAANVFEHTRVAHSSTFERDLRVMKICVSAAPLVGLLGTVTGMLQTFDALASGSGGEKTMTLIAAGISEALVTTETGLVIALPGLYFQYFLSRLFERYKGYLAHLEAVCTMAVHASHRDAGAGRAA